MPAVKKDVEYQQKTRRTKTRKAVRRSVAELQEEVLGHLADGLTVRSAMAKVDRSPKSYDLWRMRFPGFADKVDRIRARARGEDTSVPVGDFGEFRDKYLDMATFAHQWQWVDVLEGREPRDMHDAIIYLHGRPQRILINTPPYHAKTATLTIDYAVYRICADPNVKIIIISESRDMARKMLSAIKERLTHPRYEKLHTDFGPAGGFKVGSASWTQDLIYVGNRDSAEKDPTVEVLGVGSQIYGARADLILLDDCITLKTAGTQGRRDKILQWLDQEVSSRLGPEGKLVFIGTRVSPNDVYSQLLKRDADREDGRRVWTYLAQPAVLEYGDTPAEWETLWPFKWNGEALATRQDEVDASTWNLVYQQHQVAVEATFPEEAVNGCRYMGTAGPLQGDRPRKGGMTGLQVLVGLDPAGSGYTAMVVLGVDKATGLRYILDVVNQRGMSPHGMREHIKRISARYKPNEWRIEKNGLQTMISQDNEIRQIIHTAGARLVEHHTGANKWDADFGVASMAPLFLGATETPPRPQILIPDNGSHKGIKALLDQLISWEPNATGKTDILMALWFAELGARKMLEQGRTNTHAPNKWLTKGQAARRTVVNIDELIAAQAEGQVVA
jgi:hypothetical protein